MEILPLRFYQSLKRHWRRRRYQRLEGTAKKSLRVVRLGGHARRVWTFRPIPKLRLRFASPLKILARIRDAYVDAMLGLAGRTPELGSGQVLASGKRIPRSGNARMEKGKELERRLFLEICRSIAASRELAAI